MEVLKAHPTVGACGLDCGLCPRYYTVGTSRCPGCAGPGFAGKHPSCSFITCCVKKHGLEVCGLCPEYPCAKFKAQERYLTAEPSPSYPPYRLVPANLRFIREEGLKTFLAQQARRMALLEAMIDGYDEGRSRSFFCRAAALLDTRVLADSLNEAKQTAGGGCGASDRANKAIALKTILTRAALARGIELVRARR